MTTETNAERLENIKDNCEKLAKYERDYGSDDVNITPIVEDLRWLIQQMERVQELEDVLEQDAGQEVIESMYEENKRYREAFQQIVNIDSYFMHRMEEFNPMKAYELVDEIARQALEEST